MKLTKTHKVYAAVLGLAVAAFAADRFVLSPAPEQAADAAADYRPAAAPAAAARSHAAARPTTIPTTAPAVAVAAEESSTSGLAARMQAVAGAKQLAAAPVADAFKPDNSWVPEVVVAKPVEAAKPTGPSAETLAAKEFAQGHQLTGVMNTRGGGVAVINGKMLRPGQTIDGFRLVSVKARSAQLRRGKASVELRIQDGGAAGSVAAAK